MLAFVAQAIVRKLRPQARIGAQMTGAVGLTITAPAAFYVVAEGFGPVAWLLWAANLLLAWNQIQFVQLRIHAAQLKTRNQKLLAGRAFLAGQLALAGLLAGAAVFVVISWRAALAFFPVLFRGSAWFASTPKPLAVHALGKTELAHARAFGILLIFSEWSPAAIHL